MTLDETRVTQILEDANPWWRTGTVPQVLAPAYRRRDFFPLRDRLEHRPVTALAGPRQVGKTTLVYQVIQTLLSQGVSPDHILFVSFDLPGLDVYSDHPLDDCIRIFEERILRQAFRDLDSRAYMFFDEVTKEDNWARALKGWYDFQYDARFLVTSSSVTELNKGLASSLVGRASTQTLVSWKFIDVMSARANLTNPTIDAFGFRTEITASIARDDAQPLYRRLSDQASREAANRIAVKESLEWYLLVDGFPELIRAKDLSYCQSRLDEYVKLTLIHDLYRFHKVRATTQVFEELLGLVAAQSGGLMSYRNLANSLDLELRTLRQYLDFLEEAFLISRAQFYSGSRASRSRKQRKLYIANPGFLNSLLGRLDRSALTDPTEMGMLAETIVHCDARRLSFNLSPGRPPAVYYWRDKHGHEVDVVLEVNRRPIPIEVKYRDNPRQGLEGMREFVAQKHPPFGIVVTKDLLALEPPLLFVPLQDFLLIA
jgi:uncharacterized protein